MPKLMIIDGNSIVNRAFYGIRPLSTKDGIPTNAIYGFLNIMLKETKDRNPDYLTVAFDVSRHTVRNDIYKEYKAQRSGMPDDLAAQLPYLKQILNELNIPYTEKQDYEADDIIGTISKICEEKNVFCEILTGDRDDLQLCSEMTTVLLVTTKGGKTTTIPYKSSDVMEKYGVTPLQFIDLKGLMGDTSDNIPGVKGIGEVTAKKLISEYKSIENLYEHLDELQNKKALYEKLKNGKEMAFLSKKLATIIRDLNLDFSIENCKRMPPKQTAAELFNKLEFSSFINRLDISSKKAEKSKKSLEFFNISEYKKKSELYYIIEDGFIYINDNQKLYKGNLKENIDYIKELMEDDSVKKYSYGIKEQLVLFNEFKTDCKNMFFDAKIAAYTADPTVSNYSYGYIAHAYLSKSLNNDIDIIEDFPLLCDRLQDTLLENNLDKLFFEIEMPIIPILANMQIRGIKIDVYALKKLSKAYEEELENLTHKIYDISKTEFNINSTKQLSEVLFNNLGLKPVKKNKTGYSTDNSVLEALRGENEIIDYLLKYRMISKLKTTYVDGLYDLCDRSGILHSKFHQTVTQTGRLSSSDPNLQNIPIKTEEGRRLRELFTPVNPDNIFVSADYSQIELRVLAQICGDENLTEAFRNKEDIHTQAASRIFNVNPEEVTLKMRATAKTVNFGILYGKSEFTLSKDLGISRKEAKEIIENYLNKYPGIQGYMSNIIEYAKENGYVKTLLGRIRFIKELSDRNFMTRKAGERIALNTPIQGTAADIMKIAMIKVSNRLKSEFPTAEIVLQIHDELVIECSKRDMNGVKELLCECMTSALSLNVPLDVSAGCGNNLYELK